jgi:hypothetical protein
MRNTSDTPSNPWLCLVTAALLSCGCVSQRSIEDASVDRLDEVPAGARLIVTTADGRKLTIRVTESAAGHIVGIDRHYREYRLNREEISDIHGQPQNDVIVALTFFAVVFVTGF